MKLFLIAQLNLPELDERIAIGLFKDSDFSLPTFNFGTVLTLVIHDINAVCSALKIMSVKFTPIQEDISDFGYIDRIPFLPTPIIMKLLLGKIWD